MTNTMNIRIVVPRMEDGRCSTLLVDSVAAFFSACGEDVRPNEKLLRLPSSVPAVLTGEVTRAAYNRFLNEFPALARLTVTALPPRSPALRLAA